MSQTIHTPPPRRGRTVRSPENDGNVRKTIEKVGDNSCEVPDNVLEACCANKVSPVKEWLANPGINVNAPTGLSVLFPGTEVEARFHGGDEFYEAVVKEG
jgi:hypothetical protein